MYPVVNITCSERNITQKADVLEYRPDRIRVVVQGTSIAINLKQQDGHYVGQQAGLEFVCLSTYNDIADQADPR